MDDDLHSDIVRVECPHGGRQTPLGIVRVGKPTITLCERCGATFAMDADEMARRIVRPQESSAGFRTAAPPSSADA